MRQVHAATAVLLTSLACATSGGTPDPAREQAAKPAAPAPPSPAAAAAFAEFTRRVEAYTALHGRLEGTLPRMPTETTPEVIDKHQRALARLIQTERKSASRGDIFTPEADKAIRAVLLRVFGGPDGKQLKASIMDENPVDVKLSVNSRYPDDVPLSTVPPQVLAALPKLPADVEYRFIGDRLILLDVHAHIIVDYIDRALPV